MARASRKKNFGPVIDAAQQWIHDCLAADSSIFSDEKLWEQQHIEEVRRAFVEHPDEGAGDFITKLKGQMSSASPQAQRLMAEMLWALFLFPSNVGITTKRRQISEIWKLSGDELSAEHPMLSNAVLTGIGSAGSGFNNYRWRELAYLINLAEDLKQRAQDDRQQILSDYDTFLEWIQHVPQPGRRQFRHMLRFFCFPERVERISANRERRRVLQGFGVVEERESRKWNDKQLDDALLALRRELEHQLPNQVLDFYEPPLLERWKASELTTDAAEVVENLRFWVEKTLVAHRPDRQAGDHALGRALWSPQRAEGNRDIYRLMRDVRPGDVVFHFVDNQRVD